MKALPAGKNTELVGHYVSEHTGVELVPGMYQAMAILTDEDVFCGGVVITDYKEFDCQISCAVERGIVWRDTVMETVFSYVFKQLGCVRCTAVTKKNDKRTRTFLEGLGFVLEGRIRRGYDGIKDALVYGLLAEECLYIQQPEPVEAPEAEPVETAEIGG